MPFIAVMVSLDAALAVIILILLAALWSRLMTTEATVPAILAALTEINTKVSAYTPPVAPPAEPVDLTSIAASVDEVAATVAKVLAPPVVATDPAPPANTLALADQTFNVAVNAALSETLVAENGVGPYHFTTATSMPFSLSEGGILSGTTSAPGTTVIDVVVTDSAGASASATITVIAV